MEKLRQNYGTERILAQLANYGIPNKLAFQIQDFYKEETLQIVEQQPTDGWKKISRHGL